MLSDGQKPRYAYGAEKFVFYWGWQPTGFGSLKLNRWSLLLAPLVRRRVPPFWARQDVHSHFLAHDEKPQIGGFRRSPSSLLKTNSHKST